MALTIKPYDLTPTSVEAISGAVQACLKALETERLHRRRSRL